MTVKKETADGNDTAKTEEAAAILGYILTICIMRLYSASKTHTFGETKVSMMSSK